MALLAEVTRQARRFLGNSSECDDQDDSLTFLCDPPSNGDGDRRPLILSTKYIGLSCEFCRQSRLSSVGFVQDVNNVAYASLIDLQMNWLELLRKVDAASEDSLHGRGVQAFLSLYIPGCRALVEVDKRQVIAETLRDHQMWDEVCRVYAEIREWQPLFHLRLYVLPAADDREGAKVTQNHGTQFTRPPTPLLSSTDMLDADHPAREGLKKDASEQLTESSFASGDFEAEDDDNELLEWSSQAGGLKDIRTMLSTLHRVAPPEVTWAAPDLPRLLTDPAYVKRIYRLALLTFHPDKHSQVGEASKRKMDYIFKALHSAYQQLTK